jgi:hypothetical protein
MDHDSLTNSLDEKYHGEAAGAIERTRRRVAGRSDEAPA